MPDPDLKIVGFDPGTAVTGWAALLGPRRPRLVRAGAIRAKANQPIEKRLLAIYRGVMEVLDEYAPDVVAIEDPFVGKNPSGALTLGQARGVILLAVAQRECEVVNYTPATIKASVVGKGSAEKEQVREMVTRLLGLQELPEPLDASDAIAVALCHINRGMNAAYTAGHAGTTSSGGAESAASGTQKRAQKLAARKEDADALARWLSGGRNK